jgi:glycosyltransferase involved in cell wall biosynthesis
MFISVIIRTVDRPVRLTECLESLSTQSCRDFEVVVVDMSDGTARPIVEAFRTRLPALNHLETNGRIFSRPVALNFGVRKAAGCYIAVLDDDNCWEREHIQALQRGLEESEADLVYTGVRRTTFSPEGKLLHEDRVREDFDFARLVRGNYIYASATAYRKDRWRQLGGYDIRFPVYEDWEFLIRATHNGKVATLPGFSAITQSFTGRVDMPEHFLRQPADCVRCTAAILWKHRKFCPGELTKRFGHRRSTILLLSWWWHFLKSAISFRRCEK